jgi:hypothetical protein
MKKKKLAYFSPKYFREVAYLAIDAFSIYPCKHCGYPVISGHCCTHCDSTSPSIIEEEPQIYFSKGNL